MVPDTDEHEETLTFLKSMHFSKSFLSPIAKIPVVLTTDRKYLNRHALILHVNNVTHILPEPGTIIPYFRVAEYWSYLC